MKRKPTLEIPVAYAAIAKALGFSRQRVWNWFQPATRIPAEHVLDVERITGVSRHHLRPDIYPDPPSNQNRVAARHASGEAARS